MTIDPQTIVVLLIVLAAAVYAGRQIRQKAKAFSPKNTSCGTGCGCDRKVK